MEEKHARDKSQHAEASPHFSRKKKKKRGENEEPSGLEFKVDTTDERFSGVFEGSNEHFGIDRTATEFKETENMKHILAEQSRKRAKKRKVNKDTENVDDVESTRTSMLVSKLKKKFGS